VGKARVCADDCGMGAGTSWRRPLLLVASVVLPVAVAVASNQILNDGIWSWSWVVIAVALTTVSALVTYALTRTTPVETTPTNASAPSPSAEAPLVQPPMRPGAQVQLNMPTAGGTVNAVQGGTMNVGYLTPPPQPTGGDEDAS
jgi:hypothetical protein